MKFLCDQNFPLNLAEGLNLIEKSNYKSATFGELLHTTTLGIKDYTDEQIIEVAGNHEAVIVTQDKDFKHFKHYKQLYKQYNVGVLLYKPLHGKDKYWDKVLAFVNNWEKIKKIVSETEKPFVMQFDLKNVYIIEV